MPVKFNRVDAIKATFDELPEGWHHLPSIYEVYGRIASRAGPLVENWEYSCRNGMQRMCSDCPQYDGGPDFLEKDDSVSPPRWRRRQPKGKTKMPATNEQKYLLTIEAMCTSDEAHIVPSVTAVLKQSDLVKFGILEEVADALLVQLEGAPMTDLRPMNDEEIADWRGEDG